MLTNFAFSAIALPATLLIGLLLLVLAFEIIMFVDAFRNPNIPDNKKILWLCGMVLLHPFVAIAYYFTDYRLR